MCSYVVPQEVDALARRTRNNNESTCNDGHFPVAVESNKQVGCAVCMLEYRWKKQELKMGGGGGWCVIQERWEMRQVWDCGPHGGLPTQTRTRLENPQPA